MGVYSPPSRCGSGWIVLRRDEKGNICLEEGDGDGGRGGIEAGGE